jgi:FkbM family methyltransferase
MIITFADIVKKYDMKISGVIHIGGHYGEEVGSYVEQGINDIVLFEPLKENFEILKKNVSNFDANIEGHRVALGNSNGNITMNLSSNGLESSSILKPKLHLELYPDITFDNTEEVEIKKLDDYNYSNYNFMNMDVQGYELEVLRGGSNTLQYIDYLYCEVNRNEVYEGNAYIQELDDYLSSYSMKRVETSWWDNGDWGDALYIKEKV